MLFYFFRHAPTQANEQGLILGATDPPATEQGLAAFADLAQVLARTLPPTVPVHVFSSPLVRAQASARILAQALGAPLELVVGLGELAAGVYEGRLRREALPLGRPLRQTWADRPCGGESMADAEQRVAEALAQIRRVANQGAALLVGHAVVNRVLVKLLSGWPDEDLLRFVHPHDAMLLARPDQTMSWLDAEGRSGAGLPGKEPRS